MTSQECDNFISWWNEEHEMLANRLIKQRLPALTLKVKRLFSLDEVQFILQNKFKAIPSLRFYKRHKHFPFRCVLAFGWLVICY
jgi:hypothetical protein